MKYLEGVQIQPSELKNYLGKKVIYLFKRDIDRSGRGYYFPRTGTITAINGRRIDFDDKQEYRSLSDLVECVEATEENIKKSFY